MPGCWKATNSMDDVAYVLSRFGWSQLPPHVDDLGHAGGFSGANLWRLKDGAETLCLRRWPAELTDDSRLRFIHQVQRHAARQMPCVPQLRLTLTGESFVQHADHFWELAAWLPGKANYHREPTPLKLRAALQTLAEFHLVVADFHAAPAFSPGLTERCKRLNNWLDGGIARLQAELPHSDWPELPERGARLVQLFLQEAPRLRPALTAAAQVRLPLQACLRDIWHDHVLFEGARVTGLVDFGAARMETVACDIARLLGSLVGDNSAAWQFGLNAYLEIRPLSHDERELVTMFDASGVLLAGMSWLEWLILERREFRNHTRVLRRIDDALARLERRARPAGLVIP
ncbi:MAG TPA: phosphotransferase [Pirellulaceae bacterium]|nr:phosphotransferase [Pirellulaceae bacterium]